MYHLLLFVAALTVASLFYSRTKTRRPAQLGDIVHVDLKGDKSPGRYVAETGNLITKGYAKYSKKGLPFSIPNLSDFSSPLVILPLKYLDEVAHAPQNQLSLKEYFSKLGLLKYSYGPPIADEVQRVAKSDLNQALNELILPLQEVCQKAYEKDMPCCTDWTPLRPYNTLMSIFVRITALTLVGPELHDAWTALSFEYLPAFMKATRSVGTGYHESTRWLARYIDADVKNLIKCRRKAADLLRPALEHRLAELRSNKAGQKHQDAIQWLIVEHRRKGHRLSPDELAQNLLVLTVSSTHQTTMVAVWLLFELINHPDSLEEIKLEISRIRGQEKIWTRRKLQDLRIMDSFMTETMRVHSFTQTTVNRMVMKPYIFKDGLILPAGTQISFPTRPYSIDETVHSDPLAFDPKRHLVKRERGDSTKYHFASTADSLVWGSGPHACPGRFLVQDALKLIFIHMLAHYSFRYPDDGKTHPSPDMSHGIMIAPDVSMPILFKEED
ncbi:cytochrome P450 [Nemania abortiva]|nr:cytochrome P450 [Nemania abortiva]